MEILWAPWRSKYVSDASKKKTEDVCIFCKAANENKDNMNYVVYRGKHNFVMLNIFPYNPGHVMISPYRHVGTVEALTREEAEELFELVKITLRVMRKIYQPDGFNIGINIGRAAGAGVEAHVHVHVVPRWNGDANFMPVLGNTKVLPEDLDTTYQKLKKGFEDEMKKPSNSEK